MKQVYLTYLLILFFFPIVLLAQENVLIFGDAFAKSGILKKNLEERGLKVQYLTADDLQNIQPEEGRLLLIGEEVPCPPDSRIAISNYLAKGGNIIVVGSSSFDYAPKPIDPVAVVDFGNNKTYQVVKPEGKPRPGSMDQPTVKTVEIPQSGEKGLSLSTERRGMAETLVQFSVKRHASATRSVLTFKAKGNHYMDLLAVEAVDADQKKWVTFVPISLDWQDYTVSFADFVPDGWNSGKGVYPLLDPSKVSSLSMGVNLMAVWREKPMAFSIAGVSLCKNETGTYAPTSSLASLRLPFKENGITLPGWILDPFFQSTPLKGPATLVTAKGSPFGGNPRHQDTRGISILANALTEFPGSLTGTDTKKDYDHRADREKRIIPILETDDGRIVARLDIHAGGPYKNSAIAMFGIRPETVAAQSDLQVTLADVAGFILKTPRVLKTSINTTVQRQDEDVVPKFTITLHNPTAQTVKGKLVLDIDGMPQKKVDVEIPHGQALDRIIQFGAVPADFSFKKFDYKIELTTPASNDRIHETVDVERSMLEAFIHLVGTQKKYPDGRYSHHYFGDAYGVRAMFAYLDFLERNPEHLSRNKDLWARISPADIEKSALWFCDMLAERQLPTGALPMGYSEHAGGYNVADGGQMALALAQLSRYVKDDQKRKAYMKVCYRFADWAETFYIDKAKSDSLKTSNPEAYKKGHANEGFYGLGQSGRRRLDTGPSWVLADIIGVQVYLAYIDKSNHQQKYRNIAERNVKYYANAQYSAAGYYQAEALFWSWLTTDSQAIKQLIEANLKNTFLPPLYKGKLNDMYDIGSRSTLRALPLLYYQQFLGNTAGNRAVLLKYIWSFGANSSMSSMQNLSRHFPKPVHGESLSAAKYAALSALWAMELLEPGSTLYPEVSKYLKL